MRGASMQPLTIDVVSDVMCPWCYIGKRRLEGALALRPEVEIDVRWRAYKLDPTIPRGGVDRQSYLENKFGGAERAAGIYAQVAEAGAQAGLDFHFDAIRRSPNTTDAHRLIRWSYGQNAQDSVVEGLFRTYFIEGGDVEDPVTLGDIATAAGMDSELVRELLAGEADIEAVNAEIDQARQIGVDGVPCFIIGARLAVMGAQASEILVEAIDKVLSSSGEDPEDD
ncbi:MAG: DsbA family oxidoreductase [Rhodobiaceae bacterium]|nr:DsbA family oxidoreductase [Rhodobiaceae bacterium]MCC0015047.1 DsbA family oxidoreductase [Rhodobiaceae bacterium]MCC0052945.1 DsbA family oxidoreductase [Rhodobiaceae bacterium]